MTYEPALLTGEAALVARAGAGDHAAQTDLLAQHNGILHRLVKRVWRRYRHTDLDDLLQAGRLGVLNAAKLYDPASGVKFLTYASHAIYRHARREAQGSDLVRVPVHAEGSPDARRARGVLHLTGRRADGDETLDVEAPPSEAAGEDERRQLQDAIAGLTEREQQAARLCLLEGLTCAEAAAKMGVSTQRVSQLKLQALESLRERLNPDGAVPEAASGPRVPDVERDGGEEGDGPAETPPRQEVIMPKELSKALIPVAPTAGGGPPEARSSDELRQALAGVLHAVAERCLEAARIIRVLEERGEDLTDIRRMLGWVFQVLRRLALGEVAPLAFRRFAGSRVLLECVSALPPERQDALARGEKVPLYKAGACQLVDPLGLAPDELRQVFGPGHVRGEAEQAEFRRQTLAAKARPAPDGPGAAPAPRGFGTGAVAEKLRKPHKTAAPTEATAKDLADMLAGLIAAHSHPRAVLGELLADSRLARLLPAELRREPCGAL